MIPGKIIRFLEERANAGFAGTRDGNLVPSGHRVCGWQVDAAGRTLTALVPLASANRLVEALLDNGRIACTFEEVGTHETYQIKGRYLGHRPVHGVEAELADRVRERLTKALYAQFQAERIDPFVRASIPTPTLAVAVEVTEVFVQTPGPGAGERIAPSPDAR